MVMNLDRVVAEVVRSPLASTRLSQDLLLRIWQCMCSFACESLMKGKSVRLTNVFQLMFQVQEKKRAGGQRTILHVPHFFFSEKYTSKFQVQRKQQSIGLDAVSGQAPIATVNYVAIAQELGLCKDDVQVALRDIFRVLGDKMESGFHVGLEFPRVGKLLCNNCKYHFSFAESLLEAVSKLDSVLSDTFQSSLPLTDALGTKMSANFEELMDRIGPEIGSRQSRSEDRPASRGRPSSSAGPGARPESANRPGSASSSRLYTPLVPQRSKTPTGNRRPTSSSGDRLGSSSSQFDRPRSRSTSRLGSSADRPMTPDEVFSRPGTAASGPRISTADARIQRILGTMRPHSRGFGAQAKGTGGTFYGTTTYGRAFSPTKVPHVLSGRPNSRGYVDSNGAQILNLEDQQSVSSEVDVKHLACSRPLWKSPMDANPALCSSIKEDLHQFMKSVKERQDANRQKRKTYDFNPHRRRTFGEVRAPLNEQMREIEENRRLEKERQRQELEESKMTHQEWKEHQLQQLREQREQARRDQEENMRLAAQWKAEKDSWDKPREMINVFTDKEGAKHHVTKERVGQILGNQIGEQRQEAFRQRLQDMEAERKLAEQYKQELEEQQRDLLEKKIRDTTMMRTKLKEQMATWQEPVPKYCPADEVRFGRLSKEEQRREAVQKMMDTRKRLDEQLQMQQKTSEMEKKMDAEYARQNRERIEREIKEEAERNRKEKRDRIMEMRKSWNHQVREHQDLMDEEYLDTHNTMTSLVFEEDLERTFHG